jgi:hypothetical protein
MIVTAVACLGALLPATAVAQSGTSPDQPTGQKTLAATMGVYVYPTKGQTTEQQSMDEVKCYNWGVQQTGTDPFDLAKLAEQQQAQAAQQATQQQLGEFKKAFSVCLEARDYMVK